MYQSSIIQSFLFLVFINYFYDKLIKVVSFERNCGAASVWGWWLYYRIILVLSTRNSYNSVDKTNEPNYLVSMAVWLWLTVLRSNISFGVMSKVKKNVNFLSLSFFFLFFFFLSLLRAYL